MFAVGHMSIAYLLGKGSAKFLHVNVNIPLLMVVSILPDTDIIYDVLTNMEIHRGPTHSIITALLVFIPIFFVYRKRAIPYFLALISHSLIADFIVGGQLQLLWPFSTNTFGFHELGGYYFDIFSPINVVFEVLLFVAAFLVLYRTGDWKVFFISKKTNLLLIIPIATVLLPTIVGFPLSNSLLHEQRTLAFAHLAYLVLFSIAVLKTLSAIYEARLKRSPLHNQPG